MELQEDTSRNGEEAAAAGAEGEISLSIEETNKLRAKLGLRPLDLTSSGTKKSAEDNYAQHRDELARKSQAESIKQRIERSKNKRQLTAKLTGRTLGDKDESGMLDDSLAWIERQRQAALRLSQNYDEGDDAAEGDQDIAPRKARGKKKNTAAQYTSNELSGLSVAHNLDDIVKEGGGEVILTIRDSDVLADEGDELENVQLADVERARENVENRRKKGARVYTGYDDDEFHSGVLGMGKKNLLSQYDEEIDGPQKKGFTLGEQGDVNMEQLRKEKLAEQLRAHATTLDYDKMNAISDYYAKDEISIKKSKKKKKVRGKRTTQGEDDAGQDNGDVAMADADDGDKYSNSNKYAMNDDQGNFVDDDDLQSALANERLRAVKKRARALPTLEEISQSLGETQQKQAPAGNGDVDLMDMEAVSGIATPSESDGLVFDNRSEFVRGLPDAQSLMSLAQERLARVRAMEEAQARQDEQRQNALAASNGHSIAQDGDDVKMDLSEDAVDVPIKTEETAPQSALIEDEPSVAGGMAATLALLRQKGELAQPDQERLAKEELRRKREDWLLEKERINKAREAAREQEKARQKERNKANKGRSNNQQDHNRDYDDDDYDRERHDTSRVDRQNLRELQDRFKDYKPNINISYLDSTGRELGPKEAFKELSHNFHGRFAGKNKKEKVARRAEQERRQQYMSSTDTPLNLASALVEKQKELGTAHIVLSVGNRAVTTLTAPGSDDKKRPGAGDSGSTSAKKPRTT
ncbi:hypothetical protein RI367_004885 [Sorochytrium milnesiophthora]